MRWIGLLFIGVFVIGLLTPCPAQAGSGWYVSGEMGANFAPSMDTTGSANDRASVCDEFINPLFATVSQTPGYEDYNCTGRGRGKTGNWKNKFDSAEDLLAGAALGYSLREQYPDNLLLGRLRIEIEYFYRNAEYDQTSSIPGAAGESGDKLAQEIQTATERIDSIAGHNLFGNLYFDLFNLTPITPYAGFGIGVAFTDMDYSSVWARNADPSQIVTGEGLPNAAQIRQNLAGTTSFVQHVDLEDTLFGYQVLFGVDYALTESISLGVKGRWVHFEPFNERRIKWDSLRSHRPNIRLDGSEPVFSGFKTDDIEMFGVSAALKYHF